jgi:hypothetical protein
MSALIHVLLFMAPALLAYALGRWHERRDWNRLIARRPAMRNLRGGR